MNDDDDDDDDNDDDDDEDDACVFVYHDKQPITCETIVLHDGGLL